MAKTYRGTLFKRGDIWYLEYTAKDQNGVTGRFRESLGVTDKKEAISEATKRTEALLLRSKTDKLERTLRERVVTLQEKARNLKAEQNRIPLSEVWSRFPYDTSVRGNVQRPLKPKVIIKHTQLWDAFVKWMAANRPGSKFLEEVTEVDTLAYSDYCKKQLKCGPRGHNDRIKICRVVCELAKQKPNPFSAVRKLSEPNESRECLERSDLQKIVELATGEMRMLVMIGLFTGLRLGDAATLRWQDVQDGRVYKVTGKTGKPVALGIHPHLQAALTTLPQYANKKKYILPELAELYLRDPQGLCKRIRELFESAGIEVVEKLPGRKRAVSRRGFHALRTSFVSICARDGMPTEMISQWAGHSPQVNAIYQKFGNTERDDRLFRAFNKYSPLAIPATSSSPVIDVEAIEIQDTETMRTEVLRRLVLADRETLKNILEILS